jgi:hypothetical protein
MGYVNSALLIGLRKGQNNNPLVRAASVIVTVCGATKARINRTIWRAVGNEFSFKMPLRLLSRRPFNL